MMDEGWGWMPNSRKKHYFVELSKRDGFDSHRSLCGKWSIRFDNYAGRGQLSQDDDITSANCAICKRKLLKERAKG